MGWVVTVYAIVNIHWDGGWLEENVHLAYDEAINKKQHDYWTQIAGQLKHYDEHVLFAGMNEPRQQNGADAELAVENIIKYQQTFINAVRATGGNNALRHLVVQAPNTNGVFIFVGHMAVPSAGYAHGIKAESLQALDVVLVDLGARRKRRR